jgi:hypothetical protein
MRDDVGYYPRSYSQEAKALIFDWSPHLDRLEKEASEAQQTRRADPWALAEAECWLELIDAEIAAHRALPQTRPEVTTGLAKLLQWRGELKLIIRRLQALERSNDPTGRQSRDNGMTKMGIAA